MLEIDIKEEMLKGEKSKGYTYVELFAGAGGMSCGLQKAGFVPIASNEFNSRAVETYKYNLGEHIIEGDIREASVKQQIYAKVGDTDIDLVAGGFPCQGFSMAGKRVIADERNSLYLELLEVVKHIKPKYICMENVEGLRSMLDGEVEKKIIADFEEIGYKIQVKVLNSADYGVAQTRKRIIFIGNRLGGNNYHPRAILEAKDYVTLGQAIEKYTYMQEDVSINHIFTRHTEEMKERLTAVPKGKSLYENYSDAFRKSPWDKPSCTVKENHGGVNIHPKLPRVLTPRELAELQSFPSDFIFKGSKKEQLVQIGNAVPPLMAKAIGLAIIEGLREASI